MKTAESLRRWKLLARKRAQLLTAEKADHRDTRKKWNEALDVGLKVVKERDALLAEKNDRSKRLYAASATLEILAGETHISPATARTLKEVAYLCRCNAD